MKFSLLSCCHRPMNFHSSSTIPSPPASEFIFAHDAKRVVNSPVKLIGYRKNCTELVDVETGESIARKNSLCPPLLRSSRSSARQREVAAGSLLQLPHLEELQCLKVADQQRGLMTCLKQLKHVFPDEASRLFWLSLDIIKKWPLDSQSLGVMQLCIYGFGALDQAELSRACANMLEASRQLPIETQEAIVERVIFHFRTIPREERGDIAQRVLALTSNHSISGKVYVLSQLSLDLFHLPHEVLLSFLSDYLNAITCLDITVQKELVEELSYQTEYLPLHGHDAEVLLRLNEHWQRLCRTDSTPSTVEE